MIKSLTTKNFRKLTDRTFEFTEGTNVVRGANEEGKSTLLEALGYLWFGVKACRDPLEEIVTWGQPVKSLEVSGVMEFDGVDYQMKRSKSGAEISYKGTGKPDVTGQNECSEFMARLLGCGADMAPRLMMAPQGAIRGALGEKGAKPVVELIESLADFNIIDEIVELIQANLLTGPTATAEDRVKRASEALEQAKSLVVAPDTAAATLQLEAARTELASIGPGVDALKAAHDTAQAELNAAQLEQKRGADLKVQLTRAITGRKQHDTQRDEAQAAALLAPAPEALEALEWRLQAAKDVTVRLAAHDRVQKLMAAYPEVCWDEGAESFAQAVADATSASATAVAEVRAAEQAVKSAQGELQTGEGACKSCGQKLPNAEAVAEHNLGVQKKIDAAKKAVAACMAAAAAAKSDLDDLQGVAKSAEPYAKAAAELAAYVEVDTAFVPVKLAWKGELPSAAGDVAAINAEIASHKAAVQAAANAAARVEVLTQAVVAADFEIERLQGELVKCASLDEVAIKQFAFDAANQAYQEKAGRASELRYEIERAQSVIASAEAVYQQQLAVAVKAEAEHKKAVDDLTTLEFNNALLKRVRAARPIIADKLWSIVLAAVSTYFSTMRGMPSAVTRSGSEFQCDGKPVGGGSLSGSALDLLGLAIRLALVRTFLPACPILTMDEPSSACDEGRTNAMFGFIAAADFRQTLLVTHDETGEAIAQNLITI